MSTSCTIHESELEAEMLCECQRYMEISMQSLSIPQFYIPECNLEVIELPQACHCSVQNIKVSEEITKTR